MKHLKLYEEYNRNLAPNGEYSNLPDNLYRLVRGDNFKEWFGDWENNKEDSSKVLDENGEPLVVYHTTSSTNVDEFRPSIDVYDSEIKKYKQLYKGIDIKDSEWSEFISKMEDEGVSPYTEFWFSSEPWESNGVETIIPVFLNIRKMVIGDDGDDGGQGTYYDYTSSSDDGVKIPNAAGSNSDWYITVDPSSIKLANGVNETFSKNTNKINK